MGPALHGYRGREHLSIGCGLVPSRRYASCCRDAGERGVGWLAVRKCSSILTLWFVVECGSLWHRREGAREVAWMGAETDVGLEVVTGVDLGVWRLDSECMAWQLTRQGLGA